MSAAAKIELARGASRITGLWLAERITPDRPAGPGEPAPSTARLTAEWLTDALCANHPDARVVDFQVGSGSSGTCAREALRVTYNEAGIGAGLPTHLYTKSSPTLLSRLFCGLNNVMVYEGNFYQRIRPRLEIETPVAYYAGYGLRSGASLLILEDLVATRGATFGDPVTTQVTRTDAEGMVEVMAGYHGRFWGSRELDDEFTWLLPASDWQRHLNDNLGFRRMFRNGLKRARDILPPELVAREHELWPALLRSLDLEAGRPATLVHQDTHSLNWYWTADGRVGIYDWQVTAKGSWAIDVTYTLSCNLRTDDRRAWERELLELYLERLGDAGVEVPHFEAAWLSYRQQMVHGLAYWLAAFGRTAVQPEIHPHDACVTNIPRLAQAVVDLETLDESAAA